MAKADINQMTKAEIIEQIEIAQDSIKKEREKKSNLLKGLQDSRRNPINKPKIGEINGKIDEIIKNPAEHIVIEAADGIIKTEVAIIKDLEKKLTQLDKAEQQQTPTPQKTAITPNLEGAVNPTNVGQSNPSQNNSNKPKPSTREKLVKVAKKQLSKAKSLFTPKKKSGENVAVAPNTPTKNTSAVSESIESKLERNLQHKPKSHLSESQKQDIGKLIANNGRVSFGEVAKFGIKSPSAPLQKVAPPPKRTGILKAFSNPINSSQKNKKPSVSQQPPKKQARKKQGIGR